MSVVALVAGLLVALTPPVSAASVPVLMGLPSFNDFSDVSPFALNGYINQGAFSEPATAAGGAKVLRMSNGASFASSSAFAKSPVATVDGAGNPLGFSTQFQFRAKYPDGEGLSFVLGNDPRALGYWTDEGYQYLNNGAGVYTPSVAVSLLMGPDSTAVGANDIIVATNPQTVSRIADSVVPGSFADGRLWSVWVAYDPVAHSLSVWASGDGIKPTAPSTQVTIDLNATLGTSTYAGFTAGSGCCPGNAIDLYSWHSDGAATAVAAPRIDPATAQPINEGATVTLDGSPSRAGASDLSGLNGWDASSGQTPAALACAAWRLYQGYPGQIAGGALQVDPNGTGTGTTYDQFGLAGGNNSFQLTPVPKLVVDSSIKIDSATLGDPNWGPAGWYIKPTTYQGLGVFLGNNQLWLWDSFGHTGRSVALDTTAAFHDYRIEADTTTSTVTVFYDGNPVLSGSTFTDYNYGNLNPYVSWGLLGGGARGESEWRYMHTNASRDVCPRTVSSYQWRQISGKPVVLSSPTAVKPSFSAPDDGDYSFELTVSDGLSSGVGDVTVHVNDLAPTVTRVLADPTATEGLGEITAFVTDPGLFDTQNVTINWGDGTPTQTVAASGGGTGWATAQAGHQYATTGTKTVSVTATDNAGLTSPPVTQTISVGTAGSDTPVTGAGVSLWATATTGKDVIKVSGSSDTFSGLVHSNTDITVSGSSKTFSGGTEYVSGIKVSGSNNTFTPGAHQVAAGTAPVTWNLADYRPGGRAALAAGTNYFNVSSQCHGNSWNPSGSLAPGLYYATCNVSLSGSSRTGVITVVSEGEIDSSGSSQTWTGYADNLVFFAGTTVKMSGSSSTFNGAVYAPNGQIQLSGSQHHVLCGMIGSTLDISGSNETVGSGCGGTTTNTVVPVAAPPVLVPNLTAGLTVNKTDANPGDTLAYTATATNGTATAAGSVYDPALLGWVNQTGTAETVAGVTWKVSYHDKVANQWVLLSSTAATDPAATHNIAVTGRGIPQTGVAYPAATVLDGIDGTTVGAGATAAWAAAAHVTLTVAQEQLLLDPTKVDGFANQVTFAVNGSGRSITRFYDNPLASIRDADQTPATTPNGADITAVSVLTATQAGIATATPTTVPALAALTPGASVPTTVSTTVAPPAPRSSGETDAAYLARLHTVDGSHLAGFATATGTASVGPVYATSPIVSTKLHVPIVTVTLTGAPSVIAGQTVTFTATVTNTGSAPATGLANENLVVANAGVAPVSGLPASLAPGQSVTTTVAWPVPATTPGGVHVVSLPLTWTGGTVSYGPVTPVTQIEVTGATAGTPTIGLSPHTAGPNLAGTIQTLTATLHNSTGAAPPAGTAVTFTVSGATTQTRTVTSDSSGVAMFSYVGAAAGTDTVTAAATIDGTGVTADPATIGWLPAPNPVSFGPVHASFYNANPSDTTITATPVATPVFGQDFADIAFNPPAGTIPSQPSSVSPTTRPFTDVTVDPTTGNASGTVVAQGNGHQAGSGDLTNFDAVFTTTVNVASAGDVTFSVTADSGFILGAGNNATRVSGAYEGLPAGSTTPFNAYPVLGAFDQPSPVTPPHAVTVHFPAAGAYPLELDSFSVDPAALSLVLAVTAFTPNVGSLSYYVGYADGVRPAGSIFPNPWQGSPNTTFVGNSPGGAYDAAAIRVDNNTNAPVPLDSLTVDLATVHFDIWNTGPLVVPANGSLILTQTTDYNFDTSDFSNTGCGQNDTIIPQVHVTVAGQTTTYADSNQVINSDGYDSACLGNESHAWQRLDTQTVTLNVVVPPAGASSAIYTTTATTRVYPSPATATGFTATNATTPTFTTSTPNVAFNTPATIAAGATTTPATVPVTDTVTDTTGAAQGTIALTSGASQAGAGTLSTYQAATTGSWLVTQAGPTTVNVTADGGWILGLDNQATLGTGPTVGAPTTSAINAYPVVAASNTPGPVTTTPVTINFPAIGTYRYELDHFTTTPGTTELTTTTGTGGVIPPVARLTITPATQTAATGQASVTVAAFDYRNQPLPNLGVTISQSGANSGTVHAVTASDGVATATVTGTATGSDTVQAASLINANATLSNQTTITWTPNPNPAPGPNPGAVASGPTPADGATITQPTPFSVTSVTPQPGNHVTSWTLSLRPAGTPAGDPQQHVVASGTGSPPTSTTLGTLDPTMLNNGLYLVDLTTLDSATDVGTLESSVIVDGKLKLGDYKTTFTDLSIPVGGLPMQVQRNYDTFNRDHTGDFSYGWNVGLSNFKVQVNRPLGSGGWSQTQCGVAVVIATFCNTSNIAHYVTVTWPDGHTESFDFAPTQSPPAFSFFVPGAYTPRAGSNTTSTLSPAPADTYAMYAGDVNLYQPLSTDLYDPQQFQLTAKDGTKYLLDRTLGLVSETDRNGNSLTIDQNGVHSSNGENITFTRDTTDANRITQINGPGGTQVGYTYDHNGDLTAVTDPKTLTTTFTYQADHYLTTVTGPNATPLQTLHYGPDGRLASITDANGHTTTITDDLAARTETTTAPAPVPETTITNFDTRGNPVAEHDIYGGVDHPTAYTYNSRDQLASRKDPNGHIWSALYNVYDDMLSHTDANGHTTTVAYTQPTRPDSITDVAGHAVGFTYDANGNLTKVVDPDGHPRTYTYTPTGQVATATDGNGRTTTSAYNAVDQLATRIDARGLETTYGYDAEGRLTGEQRPEGPVTYGYDADGQRLQMVDPTGTTTYGYDGLGHTTSVNSAQGSITYSYDPAGNRASMTTPNGSFTYGYDRINQLTTETSPAGTFGLSYTYGGIETTTRPNHVTTTNTYDPAGRLAQIDHTGPSGPLATFQYTLDPNGNRTRLDQTVNGFSWSEIYGPQPTCPNGCMDSADRLTDVIYTDTGQTTKYAYYPSGNRHTMTVAGGPNPGTTTYTYDAAQQLTGTAGPSGTRVLGYDGAGNETSDGAGSVFTYDSQNHLVSSGGATGVHSFAYSATGIRVQVDGVNQLWSQCGCGELPLLVNDGSSTQTYVGSQLVAQTTGIASSFPLGDALGTTRLVADAAGAIVSTSTYNVYGEPRARSGPQSSFGFTGQQTDPTGLVNLRARMYDPANGRFLSTDHVQPNATGSQGFSLYGYAVGNPSTFADPGGTDLFGYLKLVQRAAKFVTATPLRAAITGCALVFVIAPLEDKIQAVDDLISIDNHIKIECFLVAYLFARFAGKS